MAKWLKRLEIQKGQTGIIDVPELKQAFVLFKAPQDALMYIFPDYQSMSEWLEEKAREVPAMVTPEIPRIDLRQPFIQPPIAGIPPEFAELLKNSQTNNMKLDDARKKRLEKLMKEGQQEDN